MKKEYTSIIRWPGKTDETVTNLSAFFPSDIRNFIDPFVGSGAAFSGALAEGYIINEADPDLHTFYKALQEGDSTFQTAGFKVAHAWDRLTYLYTYKGDEVSLSEHLDNLGKERFLKDFPLIVASWLEEGFWRVDEHFLTRYTSKKRFFEMVEWEVTRDTRKMFRALPEGETEIPEEFEERYVLTPIKRAFFNFVREIYNKTRQADSESDLLPPLLLFLRSFCHSRMCRFNRSGELNVPYGGEKFNRRTICKKLDELYDMADVFKHTELWSLEFNDFLSSEEIDYDPQDFVYLAPPNDTRSEYQYWAMSFDELDYEELKRLTVDLPCRWMLVAPNEVFIQELYGWDGSSCTNDQGLHFTPTTMRGLVREPGDKDATHVVIRNYETHSGLVVLKIDGVEVRDLNEDSECPSDELPAPDSEALTQGLKRHHKGIVLAKLTQTGEWADEYELVLTINVRDFVGEERWKQYAAKCAEVMQSPSLIGCLSHYMLTYGALNDAYHDWLCSAAEDITGYWVSLPYFPVITEIEGLENGSY